MNSRDSSGYSFVEVLIVTAVLVIVSAAVFPLLYMGQQAYRAEKSFAEATHQARIAMDQLTRYLRQAGNDPFELTGASAVDILATGHIRINSDVTGSVASTTSNPKESTGDPNGTLTSIYEQVVVRYDSPARKLYIDVGYGEELLAENISTFTLSFFDKNGNATTNGPSIARVKVEMASETDYQDPRSGKISSVTLVSDVFIRNRSYELFQ